MAPWWWIIWHSASGALRQCRTRVGGGGGVFLRTCGAGEALLVIEARATWSFGSFFCVWGFRAWTAHRGSVAWN